MCALFFCCLIVFSSPKFTESSQKNEEKVDNYCFNLFTVSLMEKIYSPYVLNYLTSNPLPRYMDSKENRKIVDKLVFLDDSYQKKYIIDNLTSKRM